jgi:hypothetical protein
MEIYWGPKSTSFWLAFVIGLGLIALGVNGLLKPEAASRAFGLAVVNPLDAGFVRVKADRDLVTGLAVILFALLRMRKALSVFLCVGAAMPLIDGILVLTQHGGRLQDCWQHFITMVFVLFVSYVLYRNSNTGIARKEVKG